jgi:histidinol-phosphate aminotransferase
VANYGMPHHLRITIGAEVENSRLLAALATVLAQ